MSAPVFTTFEESLFVGCFLESLFYGIYSGIFIIFLRHQESKKYTGTTILFYLLCALYVLSVALIIIDIARYILEVFVNSDISVVAPFAVISPAISGFCDLIAQSILIYRCWIVWNRNIWVVIVPSILALAFLGTWTATIVEYYDLYVLGRTEPAYWGVIVTSLSLPMIVNALVTGLIVFRILKIYRRNKPTLHGQAMGPIGWNKRLRPIIFILIESGMALFCIQLARLVTGVVQTNTALLVYQPISSIQQMLIGITPTIIQVRVLMGSSFHDTETMVEATSSLHYPSDQRTISIPGSESVTIVHEENKDWGNDIGDQPNNDIEIVGK